MKWLRGLRTVAQPQAVRYEKDPGLAFALEKGQVTLNAAAV